MDFRKKIQLVVRKLLQKAQIFLRTALFCQLFLVLFSWPLLLWWGLPLSLLTIAGNILWVPVITLFLTISFVLFLIELCGATCAWGISLLEYITTWWLYLLSCSSKKVLCAFVCPPWWILFLIPLSALLIAWLWRKPAGQWRGCGIFVVALLAWACVFKVYACFLPYVTECMVRGKKICLVRHNNAVWLVDAEGAFAQTTALKKWSRYTLSKECHKKHGVVTCAGIIELKPTVRRVGALVQLSKQCGPLAIYVPTEQVARVHACLNEENSILLSVFPLSQEIVEEVLLAYKQEPQKLWYTIEKVLS